MPNEENVSISPEILRKSQINTLRSMMQNHLEQARKLKAHLEVLEQEQPEPEPPAIGVNEQ